MQTSTDNRGARYYVATYGDMGLEVVFYHSPGAYDRAVNEAKELHECGDLDSYTCGDIDLEGVDE